MGTSKPEGPSATQTVLEEAAERGAREADPQEVADVDSRLVELLDQVAEPSDGHETEHEQTPAHGRSEAPQRGALLGNVAMRTAQPIAIQGRAVTLRVRGIDEDIVGELAAGVSRELIQQAAETGDAVLLECGADDAPQVVGVLQTRIPRELSLRAETIRIEGEQELLLRSGRAALRLRRDGDVEIVGSRIAAMSRGLFRLVGRVLRLN